MLPAATERAFSPMVIRDEAFPAWDAPLSMASPSLPVRPETDFSACVVSTVAPMTMSASCPEKNPMRTPPCGGARAHGAQAQIFTSNSRLQAGFLHFIQMSRAAAFGPAQTTADLPQYGHWMGLRSVPLVAGNEGRIPVGFTRIDALFPLSQVGRERVALLHLPVIAQLLALHAGQVRSPPPHNAGKDAAFRQTLHEGLKAQPMYPCS